VRPLNKVPKTGILILSRLSIRT